MLLLVLLMLLILVLLMFRLFLVQMSTNGHYPFFFALVINRARDRHGRGWRAGAYRGRGRVRGGRRGGCRCDRGWNSLSLLLVGASLGRGRTRLRRRRDIVRCRYGSGIADTWEGSGRKMTGLSFLLELGDPFTELRTNHFCVLFHEPGLVFEPIALLLEFVRVLDGVLVITVLGVQNLLALLRVVLGNRQLLS